MGNNIIVYFMYIKYSLNFWRGRGFKALTIKRGWMEYFMWQHIHVMISHKIEFSSQKWFQIVSSWPLHESAIFSILLQ